MLFCYNCKKELSDDDVRLLQRRDPCPQCSMDLHSCVNCRFWDDGPGICREGFGDFIRDRQAANFCSQFQFDKDREQPKFDKAAEAKARLEALFKKS